MSVQVARNKNKRMVKFEEASEIPDYSPGELSVAQCRYYKVTPSTEVIKSIDGNIGKLITHQTLKESFAKMVSNKKPYQHPIDRNGIKGICEITEYTLSKEYLGQKLDSSHLQVIENLILVVVQKQLRANVGPHSQASKSVFVSEAMQPRWKCQSFKQVPTTNIEDLLNVVDRIMKTYVILDLQIKIKKLDPESNAFEIVIWTKSVSQKSIGIYNATGLYHSKYPKINFEQ